MKASRQVDIGEPLLDIELGDEMKMRTQRPTQMATGVPKIHDEVEADTANGADRPSRKKRRQRSKALMSVMCIRFDGGSVLAQQWDHRNLGIFRRAMKVPKAMHQFLNSIGFCTVYQTAGDGSARTQLLIV